MTSDMALVERALRGDDAAFEEIVNRHSRLVYNIALRSAVTPEDASDITQDAFLKAWRSLSSFRGECALSTWLCRITMNCACDHARAAGRHRAVPLQVSDEDGDEFELPVTDTAAIPEEEITRREEIAAVRAAIDSLPEEQRQIVTMRDITGLSYAEIAEILGLEMGTVKSRINRARNAVKNFLTERNFFA